MKPFVFVVLVWALPAQALEPFRDHAKLAFLGLAFIDTSIEGDYNGARADQTARLAMLQSEVTQRFAQEGFILLDLAPIREKLDRIKNPADCYGCELRMAQQLGADYVLVGEVQKVSNLILSMNLVMRDIATGRMIRGLSVDVRSNTDQSWQRGMRYILNKHFFEKEP